MLLVLIMFERLMSKFVIMTEQLKKLRYFFTNNWVCLRNSHATAFYMAKHLFYFELILFFETVLKGSFLIC